MLYNLATLREASEVLWPRIHRKIVEEARKFVKFLKACKNLKCIESHNEFGKKPEPMEPNEKFSLDFAGPFQNALKEKKYLLVSVDKNSGLPIASFLPNHTTDRVFEFLVDYIARNGIPNEYELCKAQHLKMKRLGKFVRKHSINI